MKQRDVVFAPEARDDLIALYSWIATKADPDTAKTYIERIEGFCSRFDFAPERGQRRDDIRPGLRVLGFEKRLTIAFVVSDSTVTILRVYFGGQNWEDSFQSVGP